MRDGKLKGKIVFVSSMLGLLSFVGYATYSPSKFAVRGLADTLRNELKRYGIDVHIFFPGNIDSPGYVTEVLLELMDGLLGETLNHNCHLEHDKAWRYKRNRRCKPCTCTFRVRQGSHSRWLSWFLMSMLLLFLTTTNQVLMRVTTWLLQNSSATFYGAPYAVSIRPITLYWIRSYRWLLR